MLRVRISSRHLVRLYNFNTETYNLPGHKPEINLTEEHRRIEHTLQTWEKDPKFLLSEIEKIYNPYRALSVPKGSNQAEINRIIELRKAQIKLQIESCEERKKIESGSSETNQNYSETSKNNLVAIDTQE